MKKVYFLFLHLLFFVSISFAQDNVSGPIVQTPVYFDVSPPLQEMVKYLPKRADNSWKDGIVKNKFNIRPRPSGQAPGGQSDQNLQSVNGMTVTDTTIVNFEGNSNTQGYYPPDTHGDVSPNYYFQVVNCHFSIYDKTGTLLLGPLDNSSIFNGLPNNANDGDAIILYDEQADRWLFSQFSLYNYPAAPFYQMIAVSTTNDPRGSWYRYEYSYTNMPDYPKFGVWPDGYYMSAHQFTANTFSYAGCLAQVFNRTQMLAGNATATSVTFTKPSSDEAFGWLPSDCDGPFPTGNPPNYFLYSYDGASNDHLGIYEFHVDWANTANSTFTNFLSLPVNAFTSNMTGITQKGTTTPLDVLNDRMMYRLQYRKFGNYATLVCNHTVDVSSTVAGIRWYELRKTTGAWSIYQQATYSPDNNSRWMASIAMDSSGNMALGYSVSGTNLYPSIRYTGRKKNDALNQMTIAEKGIFNGGGSQTGTANRWGDYSAMNCDPVAKATYWYTTEYYATTSATGWKTRIASFKFANTPLVTTLAATAITGTTATLNGTVNPNGLATNYHFEWGTTTAYGNNTPTLSAGSGTANVSVNAGLTSLTPGTTCHFRLVAVSTEGTSNGNDLSFTPGAAAVTTTAVSAITMTTASSGGNVTTDGGSAVTARGVCWATTANPVATGNHTTDGSGTGSFTSSMTGLSPSTTYHVRAYATNGGGTVYGNDLQFTTLCGVYSLPFTESFTNTTLPNCWSQVDNQGNGQIWQFGVITGQSPNPILTGNYAYLNSDLYGSGNSQNADLITPTLNLSTFTSVNLQFKHYFKSYSGSSGTLSYSINNGSTWTTIQTFTTTSTTNPTTFSQAVAAVNGQAQVKFKWNYTGTWGYYWAVDDVQVTGTASGPLVAGTIAASQTICSAATPAQLTGTAPTGGQTPYTYQWQSQLLPAAFANISGAIALNYQPGALTATTNYRLQQTSSGGYGTVTTNTVTMTTIPRPVPSISGPNSLCGIPSAGNIYTTQTGKTGYSWTVSAGGTITAGTGTSSITVTWTTTGAKTVTVNYNDANGCNAVTPASYPVNVFALPVPVITGPGSVCGFPSAGHVYSTETAMTGYSWNVSAGGTITAGAGTNSITVTWSTTGAKTVSVSYVNGNGCTAAIPTVKNVNVFALPVPVITGPGSVCGIPSAGNVYSTETAMTGYSWNVSAGGAITAGSATNAITVTWTTTGAKTVSVLYTDGNGCTAANPTVKNVNVFALPVPVITGPGSACGIPSAGNVYSTEAGMTGYSWNVSAGGAITAGSGTNAITVTWTTTGAKTVNVIYTDGTGCTAGTPTVKNVNVFALPVPSLNGPISVCGIPSAGNVYTTDAGMSGYSWTVSAGGAITAGAGTNSITVTWTTTGAKTVSVNYTNGNGCAAADPTVKNLDVHALPVPTVVGPGSVCGIPSPGNVYSTQTGMTGYSWSVSPGGAIIAGAGTNSISVTWSTTGSKTVYINYTDGNGCTAAAPTSFPVSVFALPTPTITGPAAPCITSSGNSYTTEPGMNGYSWSVSPGGVITSGSATNAVTVTWNNSGSQSVSVNYITPSGCTASQPATYNVLVNPFPGAAGSVTGTTTVRQGQTEFSYSIPAVADATGYSWSLPPGASITSGTGTNSIVVGFSTTAGSGNINVHGTNNCGSGTSSPDLYITVNPYVPADRSLTGITVTGGQTVCYDAVNTITAAGSGTSFLVQNGGSATLIAGQNIVFLPTVTVQNGGHLLAYITTTENFCGPQAKTIFTADETEKTLQPAGDQSFFTIYPNPTTGKFTLEMKTDDGSRNTTVQIYSTLGEMILRTTLTGNLKEVISLENYRPGIYFIKVVSGDKSATQKIIRQ